MALSLLRRPSAELQHRADLFGYLTLFADCSRRELGQLAQVAEIFRVGIDDEVVHEGGDGDAFWVLAEGLAHVTQGGDKIGSIQPGAGFGELALLDGGRRTASVRAVLPGRVVRFEPDAFAERLLTCRPAAARLLTDADRRRRLLAVSA
ncbi:MAG: cyclic nucleotide-binding domain-containing protein [Acidimicrobiia bacterium]|nr:cyclic nucleotide-binding domain-containing protein [Acidimicrobiia bacterium]